jgi:hypothetical protein
VFLSSFKRTLDPKSPGPAELPGDLLPMPFPWARWATVAAAAAAAVTLLVRRRLRRPPVSAPPTVVAPGPAPHERALRRLAELRARVSASPADVHVEAATVIRAYVHERFELPTTQMTSEEIAAATSTPHRTLLAGFLARCDGVKFACETPSADDAEGSLASAEMFVTQTREGGGA